MEQDIYRMPGKTEIISLMPLMAAAVCSTLGGNLKIASSHPASAPPIPHPAFCAKVAAE